MLCFVVMCFDRWSVILSFICVYFDARSEAANLHLTWENALKKLIIGKNKESGTLCSALLTFICA